MNDSVVNFRILDLFSGAGGFSYGIEKNPHFKTLLALDSNENALKTFKYNLPDSEVVVGDITDSAIKKINSRKGKKIQYKYDYWWTALSGVFIEREKTWTRRCP